MYETELLSVRAEEYMSLIIPYRASIFHSEIASALTEVRLMQGEAVKSIQVNVKQSSQHVEVNLSELKGYEKHVIVELMEEKSTRLSNNVLPCTIANCRGNFPRC